MEQETEHLGVMECIAEGAATLFATSYLADELIAEHDSSSRGEELIVANLLVEEENMLGQKRHWFHASLFVKWYQRGRREEVVHVLQAMENLDVGGAQCYEESGGDLESDEWIAFTEWYTSLVPVV